MCIKFCEDRAEYMDAQSEILIRVLFACVPFYLSFAFNSQRKKGVSTFDIGVVRVSHQVPF